MKAPTTTPAFKHLVLLGGGHSHLAVLMYFAENPLPGLTITLITREVEVPYSGALPALISGTCSVDDMHIDLRPLSQMAGVRLIHATVMQIDLPLRQLHCSGRPSINFDFLSLNIGSSPALRDISGAATNSIPVKPIAEFLQHWQNLQRQCAEKIATGEAWNLTIIGGGPASVELACAMQKRLHESADFPLPRVPDHNSLIRIQILGAGNSLLTGHAVRAQSKALATLCERGITVTTHCTVKAIEERMLLCVKDNGESFTVATDATLVATGAAPAEWLEETGLSLDIDGFIRVNEHLQSISHPFVFAAGDVASIENHPRPRSGVFAVRQGMPLAKNLRRIAAGEKLLRYIPQKHALVLISTGDGRAIASRGQWTTQGRLAGILKNWIDRRFVAKYSHVPAPSEDQSSLLAAAAMRCAGCGAKVGSTILSDVLAQLEPCTHADILSGHTNVEDAAMIQIDSDRVLLQSVDHFRAFINDPYLFARIATVHCLGDIHAMGASAHSALALVSIPFAAPHLMQAQLQELMTGCTEVLNAHNTALIGGHTSEAQELSFGLSIAGFADPQRILHKTGMRQDDVLILCKPLGTGTLFAADMRYQARHRWVENALVHMQQSNQMAAQCLLRHGATSCTDITGFGLLGHLREMIESENTHLVVNLTSLPVLDGALECLRRGYKSSLHDENFRAAATVLQEGTLIDSPLYPLLFDPQTAGGLLASVPVAHAQTCLAELRGAGYPFATIIGRVMTTHSSTSVIELQS